MFQNNQLASGGCYSISWTLAVQMQFYLLFPLCLLLLQPRKRGFRYILEAACLALLDMHAHLSLTVHTKAAEIHIEMATMMVHKLGWIWRGMPFIASCVICCELML